MLERKNVIKLINIFGKAWMNKDPEMIPKIFTNDARYYEYVLKKPIVGHAGIKKFWKDMVHKQRDIRFRLLNLYIEKNTAVAECEVSFYTRRRGIEVKIHMNLLMLLRVRNGKISAIREYWSTEHIINKKTVNSEYMSGIIDHIQINVNSYEKAVAFYSWLLKRIGYTRNFIYKEGPWIRGWISETNSVWLAESGSELRSETFNKNRIGLRELAFSVQSRELVDKITKEIEKHGGKILDFPRVYKKYSKTYYAVFFTDPDGLKLEVLNE